MLKVEFSKEYNQAMVSEIVKQLVPILVQEIKQSELPPILTRKEFMKLTGIGESKCAELFHRQDFPVNRQMGNPRVVTKDLFDWLHATAENQNEVNLKYPYQAI